MEVKRESVYASLATRVFGAAGEMRVASELLIRGIKCYRPYTDEGVDIITEAGLRIQVKTVRYPYFAFTIRDHRKVEIYVIWVPEVDRFYIIPYEVLKGKGKTKTYKVYQTRRKTFFDSYLNAWHLIKDAEEISQKFRLSGLSRLS